VDGQVFSPGSGESRARQEICFLGRTGIEKGADLLLRACLQLESEGFRFGVRLIGANHWGRWERDAYQDLLSGLGAELEKKGVRVTRTGHVPRAGIPDQLRAADIQVLPSRWQEPCALSLLEGMATGLAIVASRTGGTPEVLQDAGVFFEADDVDGLTRQLRILLREPGRVVDLGRRARERACELTWEKAWEGLSAAALGHGAVASDHSNQGAHVSCAL
jgi:glycosyltransferase involved in cell wall biosynthesis